MAGGLGIGALIYGFVRLIEGGTSVKAGHSVLFALLVGLLVGLALVVAIKLSLRQVAYDLHTFAVQLTDTALPAPVPINGDEVAYMRETLSSALAFIPRLDALPRLAHDLGAGLEPNEALELAATQIAQHLPVQGALLLVLDAERAALVALASWGMGRLDHSVTLDLDETAIGRALLERREATYSGLQVRTLLPLERGSERLTLFCLPQIVRGQPFGTFCLLAEGNDVRLSDEQRAFARAVADLLTLAVQNNDHRRLFTRESERLIAFEQIGGLLANSQGFDLALEEVLRAAARVTDSEHGSLLLLEPDESKVRYRITLKEGNMLPPGVTVAPILKHGLAGWALRERRADIIEDTERDARWLPVPGLENMRSVLVVPLLYGERALGVLTLADPDSRHYSRRSLALCSALAAYAVTILARVQHDEMASPGQATTARRLFEGQISPTALANLLSSPQNIEATLAPQALQGVAIWAGLRGLDRLCDQLSPAQVIEQILTPYVATLAAIAHEHQGYLTHYDDGAALMLFGYPDAPSDARVSAMRAAQALQFAARRLRGRWRAQLGYDIAVCAGVAAGSIISGVVGDTRFSAIILLGGAIREAARIQRLARPDEVLVTDTLAASFGADGLFPLEPLAPLAAGEGEIPRSVYRLAIGRG
ncbi:MAG: GAF domain-containing protein [Chloroflexales bacterium]|nr:GAF domain-containing protein [Chloroflexales bacterium]